MQIGKKGKVDVIVIFAYNYLICYLKTIRFQIKFLVKIYIFVSYL